MKNQFTWFGVIAAFIISLSTFFVGCNKDDLNDVIVYKGQVVYINTTTPFADLTVKVTNGKDTHCQTQTDAAGLFSLKVRVNEIDGNYYLLAGDSTCIPKKVNLGGYGQAEVDLGVIEVEGPALPTVKTAPIQEENISADQAIIGGEVLTDGRRSVTARGICYGKDPYPAIEGLHTTEGSGLGAFTSTLKNLEYNTIYYARAYATNKEGTAYGDQVKFTTEEGVAIVVTDTIINITAHSAKCKGHVESDGGFAVTKRGTCWSKRPDPTIDDDCTDDGSGKGEFTSTMKNLVENTTYYVRTYATNSTKTTYGEQIIITTLDGLAVVTTDSIPDGSITATGFSACGTVVSDCDIPVTARGFCYSTSQYPTIENDHTTVGRGLGSFKSNIINLQVGTTYYVRAYATNETATTYGEQVEVTTLDGLPVVEANEATSTATSITVTCEVMETGGFDITERGVCYSIENMNPIIDDSKVTNGKGKGSYRVTINNAQAATKYYVRAYATNVNGTVYSDVISISTKDGKAIVVLSEPTNVTAITASAAVTVTDAGDAVLQSCGICWSTNPNPTIADSSVIAIGKILNTAYTCNIANLQPNTTYYIRAYATTDVTTTYSEQKTFTTVLGLPIVETGQTSSKAVSITCAGDVTANGGYTVSERGICYSKLNSEPTIADMKIAGGSGNGTFNVTITELTPSTTFYVRAYATNQIGTAYGDAITITTQDGKATVTTMDVCNIGAQHAQAGVIVEDDGGANIIDVGICWSQNPNPTIEGNHTIDGHSLGTYSLSYMPNLRPSSMYYVRAYAKTDVAITYGQELSFITNSGLPKVTTTPVGENVTATTAISGGEVRYNGYEVLERGVCWSTSSLPTINDSRTIDGSGTGKFTSTITGIDLTGTNTYYIRAYATNSFGTAYGTQIVINNENLEYANMPTVQYGGYSYKVYPDIGLMDLLSGIRACENIVFAGYDDWMLPDTKDLLVYIMTVHTDGWKCANGLDFIYADQYNPKRRNDAQCQSAYYWANQYNEQQGNCMWFAVRYTYVLEGAENNLPERYYNYISTTTYNLCTGSTNCRVRPVRKYIAQ